MSAGTPPCSASASAMAASLSSSAYSLAGATWPWGTVVISAALIAIFFKSWFGALEIPELSAPPGRGRFTRVRIHTCGHYRLFANAGFVASWKLVLRGFDPRHAAARQSEGLAGDAQPLTLQSVRVALQ